jgi:NADPH-dependent 7-cyano-7-deazaguanine reductase QueF-like protein
MDADDWLKYVKKKLQVVQYNNREKVLLASHQLSSFGADWWDAYVEVHEEPREHQLARIQSYFPCTSCSTKSYQAEEEGVSRFETGVHVCE